MLNKEKDQGERAQKFFKVKIHRKMTKYWRFECLNIFGVAEEPLKKSKPENNKV